MRFVTAEEGHVVQAVAPVDINGGVSSDVFSMKGHQHASIMLGLGVTFGAATVTVEACDDFTPTTTEAIPFAYYAEETDGGDTLGARQAATAAGFATTPNDNAFYVIEVDAAELPEDKPNLRVVVSDPGGVTIATILVVLSGARYGGVESATAIA